MKKILLGLALTVVSFASIAQTTKQKDCKNTCEVDRIVHGGTFLGVQITSVHTPYHVRVRKVVEGTSAEKMGIEVDDQIVSINGEKMSTPHQTSNWVQEQRVGQPVKIEILRNGKKKILRGELGYDKRKVVKETVCCDELGNTLPLDNFIVYPNPSKGQFQLSFEGLNNSEYNVQVADMKGNIVFEQTVNSTGNRVQEQISAQITTAGDYLLVIEQNGKTYTEQVVFIR